MKGRSLGLATRFTPRLPRRVRLGRFGQHDTDTHSRGCGRKRLSVGQSDREPLHGCLAPVKAPVKAPTKRHLRLLDERRRRRILESVLVGVISRPVWALDDRGRVLWSSGSATCAAHDLLSPLSQQQVIAAARSALTRPRAAPHVAVAQLRDGAECIVEVALASAAGGLPIALASLSAAHVGQERVRAAAQRYELSRAETRVLELVGAGKSNRDVAAALHVAMATVKSHVRQILAKMGVRSRTQAALVAHAVAPPNADEEPD